jgi:hypothetical protein
MSTSAPAKKGWFSSMWEKYGEDFKRAMIVAVLFFVVSLPYLGKIINKILGGRLGGETSLWQLGIKALLFAVISYFTFMLIKKEHY